jgi:hypothetical protein
MAGKLKKIIILILIGLFGMAAPAFPLSYTSTTTSTDQGPGAGIVYTLDFNLQNGSTSTYDATFTIDPSSVTSSEAWYAGWVLFKFVDGSTRSTISELTAPGEAGTWTASDPSVKILGGGGHYKTLEPRGGFSGFYLTSLAQGSPPDDPTQGILLTGSSKSPVTFSFDFTVNDPVSTDLMSLKVGYYDPPSGHGNYVVNQLSQDLTPVPEPSTLLLLGSGLVSLGLWGRRKFKGKD